MCKVCSRVVSRRCAVAVVYVSHSPTIQEKHQHPAEVPVRSGKMVLCEPGSLGSPQCSVRAALSAGEVPGVTANGGSVPIWFFLSLCRMEKLHSA